MDGVLENDHQHLHGEVFLPVRCYFPISVCITHLAVASCLYWTGHQADSCGVTEIHETVGHMDVPSRRINDSRFYTILLDSIRLCPIE